MKDNIIKFKKKAKISDSEINGLFLGLVRLIKKVAIEDASENSELERREMEESLQADAILLSQKDQMIEKLKKEVAFLRSQIKVKNLKILHLSCMSAKKYEIKKA